MIKTHTLGSTNLQISPIGFGSYRITDKEPTHEKALISAIEKGVNVIDTSTNYTDGHSERLIGKVLNELLSKNELYRDNIVIVSKAGYIQGEIMDLVKKKDEENAPYEDIVEYASDLFHCIHPKFIEDQIENSLNRLKLDQMDIFLLHNPEYYLQWQNRHEVPIQEARENFYDRIKLAFEKLEDLVQVGKIKYYGISANTFGSNPDNFDFVSLDRLVKIAEKISKDHHFKVIQCPLNLFETEAIIHKNNQGKSVIEYANSKGLGVLINRPLNAIQDNKLTRLADFGPEYPTSDKEVLTEVEALSELENKFFQYAFEKPEEVEFLKKVFSITSGLKTTWNQFQGLDHFKEVLYTYIIPQIEVYLNDLMEKEPKLFERYADAVELYIQQINKLSQTLVDFYKDNEQKLSNYIKDKLLETDLYENSDTSLSQMAIEPLINTEGVSCVLVGMRQEKYVKDITENLDFRKKFRTEEWEKISEILKDI